MAGLVFSDVSGGMGLVQDCEDNLNFPPTGISSNATLFRQITRYLNSWYNKIITMILASQDSWDFDDATITTTNPIALRPMVAAQRDYRFSTSLWQLMGAENAALGSAAAVSPLKIKRIDFTYDGSTWYKAELFDTGTGGFGLGNDANTDSHFNKNAPYYDLSNNSLNIYPLATSTDVSAGAKVRIEFTRGVTEFTVADTTKIPAIDAAFHRMISLGASYDYAVIKTLPTAVGFQNLLVDYEQRLKQYYGQKLTDTQFILKSAYTNYN